MTGLGSLRRFLVEPAEQPAERCELCATPVPPQHPHLVQVAERRMLCACGPCGFLFDNPGAGGYRRVPDRYLSDPDFRLTDAQWDALQIPVGMAFFLHNSAQDKVIACYPSPAGATESELSLDAWAAGVGGGRLAAELQADVEALLVRREKDGATDCLLVPIDACYRLVGLVRLHWRGFDGGADAWQAIDGFFDALRRDARVLGTDVLRFACTGARPEPFAAGPSLLLDLTITDDSGVRVHAVVLRCQIRIEPRGRTYTAEESAKLGDLFGEPSRWGETLNPLQLATVGTTLTGFTGSRTAELPIPLTYDLDIAATKYFHGLTDGEIPLLLLFSGTVFHAGPTGVQVGLVSWHEEATFQLPVATWRAAMDEHHPASGWVRLSTRTLDALSAYRSEHVIPTWDDTVERLIKEAER